MAQKGRGKTRVGIDVGSVEGELSESHVSGYLRPPFENSKHFLGELSKKLQDPLQAEKVKLSPFVSMLQKSKARLKVELRLAKGTYRDSGKARTTTQVSRFSLQVASWDDWVSLTNHRRFPVFKVS